MPPNHQTKPRITTRALALEMLLRVETDAAYSGRLLFQEELRKHDDRINTGLLQQLVKGTLQWRGRLDSILESYIDTGLASQKPEIRNILRMGAFEVLYLDKIPREVSVNEAVNLAKNTSQRASGFVNGVLRNIVRNLDKHRQINPDCTSPAELADELSHPAWLIERWITQIGLEETKALCQINNTPWPVQLRVNTLKCSRSTLRERLEQEGTVVSDGLYCPDSLTVKALPAKLRIHELQAFKDGLFIVQDESSAMVAFLLDPQPGETVIDLCCAPGGKTTHIAAMMQNRGRLIAVDLNTSRLELVQQNCQRLGVQIMEPVAGDAATLQLDCQADRVLVDAPCSGLGVLGRKSDARWKKSLENIKELLAVQLTLLSAATSMVKPGGRLVYSTCSIDVDENEGTVEAFLAKHPEFTPSCAAPSVPAALRTDKGDYRAWPHRHQIGGAFGALFVKASR